MATNRLCRVAADATAKDFFLLLASSILQRVSTLHATPPVHAKVFDNVAQMPECLLKPGNY
jgi:hypothetical protein